MTKQISKEDFKDYEKVRQSGVTNMLDIRMVMDLSGLDGETIVAIMQQYKELMAKYPDVRK